MKNIKITYDPYGESWEVNVDGRVNTYYHPNSIQKLYRSWKKQGIDIHAIVWIDLPY